MLNDQEHVLEILSDKPLRNHISLAHVLSNTIVQINKCIIEAQIELSIYISSKRDLMRKIQLASIGL
jgi:hypothetical protein